MQFDGMHKGEWMESVIGPDVHTGKPSIYHIVRCELCIAVHAYPLPDKDGLKKYYQEQFYQVDKADMVDRYEQDRTWWEQCVYYPMIDQCIGYRPHASRILDVGAGTGIGLDVAMARKMHTFGVEPNEAQCQRLRERGHTMLHGTIDDINTYDGLMGFAHFDIVVLYETLEHSPEPEDMLLRCYDLLNPGGILVVVVPNDCSPTQFAACAKLGVKPWWYAAPQHLFYWTPKTLQLQVRRCGFQILDMRGTYPIDQHLVRGENYLGNGTLGRAIHQRRMDEELFVALARQWEAREQQYRTNLRDYRLGREIVCFARKTA